MSKTSKVFAEKLRLLRKEKGLSQESLAERANMSVNSIGSFERGERFPSAKAFDALADALNTPSDALLENIFKPAGGSEISSDIIELVNILDGHPKIIAAVLSVAKRLIKDFGMHK
jgi:transcriptional regulator with XRE-family HTH domain